MNIAATNFGTEEDAMQAYFRAGEIKAFTLNNRGPLRLTAAGKLDPEIVEAYNRTGFYVFEGVFEEQEIAEVRASMHAMLDNMPVERDAVLDHKGRPALGADLPNPVITWSKPLGDPLGGTKLAGGRAPVKMIEPEAAKDLPREVPFIIIGPLQFSDPTLRLAGHPGLLAAVATINGEDFAPFSDVMIIKKPGEGGSFAWHQDGSTHWNNPSWHPDIHGSNFAVQLFDCTAANSVWYVPGSHRLGKADIKAMVEQAGSNRLPDAVPTICKAGDVTVANRQVLHGSFPNTSRDWRVSVVLGYHPRASVLDVQTHNVFGETVTYDADWISRRAELIGYAIDARHQHAPEETPFSYRPQADARLHWDDAARQRARNYQALDLYI